VQTEAASRYCSQTALNIPVRPSRAAVFPDPGQLCGVRTENCPPGMKTGDQISPPAGYVGGGLQMQTDIAISPSGDVWVMNNW
jgi:hypothetical protein